MRRRIALRWAAVACLLVGISLDIAAAGMWPWWLPIGLILGVILGLSLGIATLNAVNGGEL